jgi:hypothetical protein
MTKKFLLKSLLPYKNGTKPFGYNGKHCEYITADGNTCAIGQYMKSGPWQLRTMGVQSLFMAEHECEIMTDEWLKEEVPIDVAVNMQRYHDILARNSNVLYVVNRLEKITGFKLPELR